MKQKVFLFLTCMFASFMAISCSAIWTIENKTTIAFSLSKDAITAMSLESNIRSIDSDKNTVAATISLHNENGSQIDAKEITLETGIPVTVLFEELQIIGESIYAKIETTIDNVQYEGISETKKMIAGTNDIHISSIEPISKVFTVTFNANNGNDDIEELTFIEGIAQKLSKNNFIKQGETFIGWATNPGGGAESVKYTDEEIYTATSNITFYAVWAKQHTLTFNAGGGTVDPASKVVTEGISIGDLPTPTKTGSTFSTWQIDGVSISSNTAYTYSADKEAIAIWNQKTYTVSFDTNEGTEIDASTAIHGSIIARPQDPKKENYSLVGWYKEDLTTEWKFDTDTVTSDITLYAKWEETIFYISNNDIRIEVITGNPGIVFEGVWSITNLVFDGSVQTSTFIPSSTYDKNQLRLIIQSIIAVPEEVEIANLENLIGDIPGSVATSVTLTTEEQYVFEDGSTEKIIPLNFTVRHEHTVTYEENGGNDIADQKVLNGELATKPNTPTNADPTLFFDAWYSDEGLTKLFDFSTPINNDVPLYAKWITKIEGTSGYTYTYTHNADDTITLTGVSPLLSGSVTLPNVIDGKKVRELGESSFGNSSTLTSIHIPEGIISIRNFAFSDCNQLNSVTVPNSISNIGEGAFKNCTSLTNITIPSSVTSIGNFAFQGTALKSVAIPNGVSSISEGVFQDCTSLATITIPEGIISIRNFAFSDCSQLTSITIPDSVTSIGEDAFYNCSVLESVTIGDGVKSIGTAAFYNCANLTNVTLPYSVETIGMRAFRNTALTSITIPNSVKTIEEGAFFNNTSLENGTVYTDFTNDSGFATSYPTGWSTLYNDPLFAAEWIAPASENDFTFSNGIITGYKGAASKVSIPSSINGQDVLSIGERAFENISTLTSVYIPEGITNIRNFAFSGCSQLNSISIPNSVSSIGEGAFKNCNQLTSITIPSSVTSIGNFAFQGTALNSITIPNSISSISEGLLQDCTALTNVTISGSVSSIGNFAFSGSSKLTNITIPDNVNSIGESAFDGCTALSTGTVYTNHEKGAAPSGWSTINNDPLFAATWQQP